MSHGVCWSTRRLRVSPVVAALLALAAPPRAWSILLSGGGNARTDCYAQLDVDTVTPPESPRQVFCVDGDPGCDHDGLCNDSCTFRVRVCVNLATNRCAPPRTLSSLRVRRDGLPLPASLAEPGCGEFAELSVPVRGPVVHPRPGKLRIGVTARARR